MNNDKAPIARIWPRTLLSLPTSQTCLTELLRN